jgi:hypothetical protein
MVNFFMHCSFVPRPTFLACIAFSTGIAGVEIHTVNALAVEMLRLYTLLGNIGKKKFFRDGGEKCYS